MSAFGDELQRRRSEAKLSLDQLAEASGVSKTYIAIIENDKPHNQTGKLPEPKQKIVDALALALDWDLVEARTLAFVRRPAPVAEHHSSEDVDPGLDDVRALQGKVLHALPTGRARERYLAKLRASAQSDLDLIEARLAAEEE